MEVDSSQQLHNPPLPVDGDEKVDANFQKEELMTGATCRICRGEATSDNPLFHPCKCKGSIKYIHESCLLEWTASKNIDVSRPGTTVNCDICHHPINFKTTYAENMPDRIPMSLFVKKSAVSLLNFLKVKITAILAGALFCVVAPLAWNAFGKMYTMLLDGEMPYPNSLYDSVIFGYRNDLPEKITDTTYAIQVALNYRFAAWQVFLVIVLHIGLYFQYDMIVRESVFGRMVLHKIGPQFTKEELLKTQLKERFPIMDDETLDNVAKIMRARDELRNNDTMRNILNLEENENQMLNGDQRPNDQEAADHQQEALPLESQEVVRGEQPGIDVTSELDLDRLNDSATRDEFIFREGDENDEEPVARERQQEQELPNDVLPNPQEFFENRRAQTQFNHLMDNRMAANLQAERRDEHANHARDEVHAAEPEPQIFNAEDLEEEDVNQQLPPPIIINLKLNLVNVLAYFCVAVLVIAGYLGLSYLIPTFIGYGLLKCYLGLIKIFCRGVVHLFYLLRLSELNATAVTRIPFYSSFNEWLTKDVAGFVAEYYYGYTENTMKSSIIIRSLPAFTCYATTIFLISVGSEWICKGYSRSNGMKNRTRRFVFQILFAIKCTFKVFTLFFIELAGFPILAGLLLDYALFAPMLSPGNFAWAPEICKFWPPLIFFVYWTIGTLYMYWFAKYIGMIRLHIIRPGVLFFIRSPDDPNIKILQDSLIHPLGIQLSRLFLSMFIYAIFIVVGFGFHTRFLFPVLLQSNMLVTSNLFFESKVKTLEGFIAPFYFTKLIIESKPSINLYVRKYWIHAFDVSARKLRLSSFILGNDIPTERGYILYRNIFYRLFHSKKAQWSNPNLFTAPKTLNQANQLFHDDRSIDAYFIPDGILMRVPSSDIVSRNYVQTLFVPVTKDNKLLKPLDLEAIKEKNRQSSGDFGYLDEQNTEFDGYSIVYTPPNFRMRYTLLIVFVWLFASLLVLTTAVGCQYLVTTLASLLLLPILTIAFDFETARENILYMMNLKYKQLDIFFVCAGAILGSVLVEKYHHYQLSKINLSEHIVPVDGVENEPGIVDAHAGQQVELNNLNREMSWSALMANIMNRGEVKFVIALFMLSIMICVLLTTVNFNLEQFKSFALEYLTKMFFPKNDFFFSEYLNAATNSDILNLVLLFFYIDGFKLSAEVFNYRNRPISVMFKMFSKTLLMRLRFVLITTFPLIVSWLLTSSLEFWLHPDSYTSWGASLRFLWRYRLQKESDSIPWTIPQHLSYMMICIILGNHLIWTVGHASRKWFGAAVQNVKDEVYARGRILENFSSNE
ncbi:SSM4 (YIL030C) [Zygosaccharomyces parabailii]|nr:SSM4 (YIL030C) [Zygosaccharomyces parabailii]